MTAQRTGHECTKDEAFQGVTDKLEDVCSKMNGLTTDIALVKKDTTDLKDVTREMSSCIKALTESSIKTGENLITRDIFYGKIDEIQKSANATIAGFCVQCTERHRAIEERLDGADGEIKSIKTTVGSHASTFKWFWGLLASLVVAIIVLVGTLFAEHLIAGV